MNTEKRYAVYLLHATDDPYTPRYVGMTGRALCTRLGGHFHDAYATHPNRRSGPYRRVLQWIRVVLARGAHVEITPVLEGLDLPTALEVEAQLIQHLRWDVTNQGGEWECRCNVPPPPIAQPCPTSEEILALFTKLAEQLGPEGIKRVLGE